MRRLLSFFLLILFLDLVYGFYISTWNPNVYPASYTHSLSAQSLFFDYSGCLNIKTNKTSGGGDLTDITTAARDNQVDFLITTETNDYSVNPNDEGYLNNVLLFVGGEYGYLEGRILNFDFQDTSHIQGPGRSQSTLADLLSQKDRHPDSGVFVLAHPFKPGYTLSGPFPEGLDGIELMNLKDVWQRAWMKSKASFFWNLIVYPFNSKLTYLRLLATYGDKELAFWDRQNQTQKLLGFFGSAADANTRINRDWSVPIPSYKTIFSIIRNHVLLKSELTGNAEQDRKKISEALRNGSFYLSVDILENPKGFEAYLNDSDNSAWPLGSEVPFRSGQEFIVRLPERPNLKFEIVIFKNGDRALTSDSPTTRFAVHSPGVYRAAVRIKIPFPFPEKSKWINWIITNPIYVR